MAPEQRLEEDRLSTRSPEQPGPVPEVDHRAVAVEHDPSDVAYAGRLAAAGVQCETLVVEGAYHGFDALRWASPVSRQFRDAQIAAVRSALGTEG